MSDNENNAAEVVAPTVPTAIIPVPAPVAPVMNATPPEMILETVLGSGPPQSSKGDPK